MTPILMAIGIFAFFLFCAFLMFIKFYHKVEQGKAMIVNTLRSEPEVTFTGRMVYPVIHKMELMDISLKTIVIKRAGNAGLICRDNIRADIEVTFFVHVNKAAEDVLRVAQTVGCERASSQETLEELFAAKFAEALKTVGKAMDFEDLYQARDKFRDEIIRQIGDNLSGYVLEDAAIDYLEQTPLDKLDRNNILDAQGIRKITELTAIQHVTTNELQRNEQMQIKKKDVETTEAILSLQRQQSEAEARQQREIATVQAREKSEADRVKSEEHAKAELARIQADQQIAVQQENMQREKEVAENNRKRAVAIEEEKVTRARSLEIVDREREVALQEINKERVIEVEKKAIADVIRERIVVERTVAEQEEAIKELRMVAEADRTRKAVVIGAEAQAEEKMVLQVKAAEADERRAKFKANEELTLADAKLKVAEKDAEAKKREAEGMEAIDAAPGLAAARVMNVQADAKEKDGLAQARIRIADAEAVAKQGAAEADALRLKMEAEATGREKLGLADVQVKAADADAVAKQGEAAAFAMTKRGEAEANVIEARLAAESKGLAEKFGAMQSMSDAVRAHEEFRLRLDYAHIETMQAIEANTGIAREQALVLSEALSKARIDIVGGEGDYFGKFVNSLAIGKAIDGTIAKSDTLQLALKDHLAGERDLITDAKGLLGSLGSSADELQNLSVASLLHKVGKDGSPATQQALAQLLQTLRPAV
ncbi:Inner membrane protein YqiK [Andreprevotia sp. IGB-42]|uniref:flotillin family protein n=1 Tax=Andreprevotia sp. IGB-42 TaxID=2497473 RepID=UPI00135ADE93|nr:hypothetical protein [Andreprevotia sp. IGB-42]KAF0813879.1 Inner membrane protein YqiK [Andreprevotia sp. IGB-42]